MTMTRAGANQMGGLTPKRAQVGSVSLPESSANPLLPCSPARRGRSRPLQPSGLGAADSGGQVSWFRCTFCGDYGPGDLNAMACRECRKEESP